MLLLTVKVLLVMLAILEILVTLMTSEITSIRLLPKPNKEKAG